MNVTTNYNKKKLSQRCFKTDIKNSFDIHLPASYVPTQYDAKALKESWEKLVDGHVGPRSWGRQSITGYVLSMDQHIAAGDLHGDDGMGGSERSGDVWGVSGLWSVATRKEKMQSEARVSENTKMIIW